MTLEREVPPTVSESKTVGAARVVRWAGREWQVREIPAAAYDRRGGGSLIFETPEVVRRVRNFPSNWRELSDAELYGMSLGS